MSKAAVRIRKGAEQAVRYAMGRASRKEYRVHLPARIVCEVDSEEARPDRAGIRRPIRVPHQHSAPLGSRQARAGGATRAHLLVIDRAPAAVRRALRIT
jgi:putative transcriptional regulator